MSRKPSAALVIPFLVSVSIAAQVPLSPGLAKAREQFLTVSEKGDKTAAQVMAEDFLWIGREGRIRDKKTWTQELQPTTGKNLSAEARTYPGGAIVVTHRRNADGTETRFLQVWLQQGNEWKWAVQHGVPVGEFKSSQPARPSSPLPPNSGPAADIKAIEAAMDALAAGNQRADARNFAASVTDQFVGVTANGLSSKQSRVEAISKNQPQPSPNSTIEQSSTRVYGDLAVTNRVTRNQDGRTITTVVHVRQTGKWLRAGIAFTPVSASK